MISKEFDASKLIDVSSLYEVRFRAHILLLLADGHTWATVATLLPMNSRASSRGVGEPGTGAEVPHELPRQFTGRRGAGHRRRGCSVAPGPSTAG